MTEPRFKAGKVFVEEHSHCATYPIDDTRSDFGGYHAGRVVVYGSADLRDLIIGFLNAEVARKPPMRIPAAADDFDLPEGSIKPVTQP